MEINYFYISNFKKYKAEDFKLILSSKNDTYISQQDYSTWKKINLYELNISEEVLFYRLPIPPFNKLIEYVKYSKIKDNKYGAAIIAVYFYPEELYNEISKMIDNKQNISSIKEIIQYINLDKPSNKSIIKGKSLEEIFKDNNRWVELSEKINALI